MWARVVEVMLACWMALSPFIFRHPADATTLWVIDYTAAALIALFALLAIAKPLRKAHLGNLAVGAILVGIAFFHPESPPPPPYQNYVTIGLLLMMFAIVPSAAHEPPVPWQEYYEQRAKDGD